MTTLNHRLETQRRQRRSSSRATLYADSVASWNKVLGNEQTRFITIASDHARENQFCASVVTQVAAGRPVSAKQAGVLMRIATEHGWRIPSV